MTDHERAGAARLEYFPRCATCRWATPTEAKGWREGLPPFALRCARAYVDADTMRVFDDDSCDVGEAWLCVSPAHGCVMWEAKP